MRLKKMALALAIAAALVAPRAWAEGEKKVIGSVVKIEMAAADAKEAKVTLRSKGKPIVVIVKDELTLNKFRVKKIRPGDEIRCVYTEEDGANVSKTFLKTAGC